MAEIGIMGGTFDPIHNGHLLLGRQAYREYGLDQVWYMPSGQPPHKSGGQITTAEDRCAMVALAIKQEEGFRLSEFETSREGTSYTARTLRLLKEKYPDDEFSFIIGADSLYEIENWYHPEEVLAMARILVASREYEKAHRTLDEQIAYLERLYHARIDRLHCGEMDISSHQIRQAIREGGDVRMFLPPAVLSYIQIHHLYQEEPDHE